MRKWGLYEQGDKQVCAGSSRPRGTDIAAFHSAASRRWLTSGRVVFVHKRDHPSRWAAVVSIAEKIGCVPQTLHGPVKKAEVNSGKRAGVPTEVADNVKALEREVRVLRQAKEILRKASAKSCAGGTRPPVPGMIAFIADHRDPYWGRADLPCSADCPIYLPRARRAATVAETPVGEDTAQCCSQARDRTCVRRELRGQRHAQGLAADRRFGEGPGSQRARTRSTSRRQRVVVRYCGDARLPYAAG